MFKTPFLQFVFQLPVLRERDPVVKILYWDFDQVAVQLRCVTALCSTPTFVEYQLIIASSDSIFVSSVSKNCRYNFIYEKLNVN